MKSIHRTMGFCLLLLGLAGCATTPPPAPKFYISQAVWGNTTPDKVYSACLTALTIERFSLHPVGTRKSEGLIKTNRRTFSFRGYSPYQYRKADCYYALQIVVTENQEGKVAVYINAVDAAYDYFGGDPGASYVFPYMNNETATHIEKFFEQMAVLLGEAEYYQRDKILFSR